MRRLLTRSLLVCAAVLAAVALVACGDDEETTSTAAAEPSTSSTAGGGSASTLEVSADPSGALAFEQDTLETSAGSVEIDFTNDSSTPHDVTIENADGEDVGATDSIIKSSTSATVDLEAGDYTFYCSVDSHRDAGMEGTLTVN